MSEMEDDIHKRPRINAAPLGQHTYATGIRMRWNATDEELFEQGYEVIATIDGSDYAWASELRFDNFMSAIHIHKKEVTNIKRRKNA